MFLAVVNRINSDLDNRYYKNNIPIKHWVHLTIDDNNILYFGTLKMEHCIKILNGDIIREKTYNNIYNRFIYFYNMAYPILIAEYKNQNNIDLKLTKF
jgi:hypothetical protein